MLTNGGLPQNTMDILALTRISYGGGEHSSLLTAMREPNSSVLQLELLVFL